MDILMAVIIAGKTYYRSSFPEREFILQAGLSPVDVVFVLALTPGVLRTEGQ